MLLRLARQQHGREPRAVHQRNIHHQSDNPTNGGERLYLVNGQDDDGDGWVDEGFDGIDNDGDGTIDPGFNGIDNDGMNGIDDPGELTYFNSKVIANGGEYETEVFTGTQSTTLVANSPYTIFRRPVVSPGTNETTLPDGIVIDLTTWNASRSTPVVGIG